MLSEIPQNKVTLGFLVLLTCCIVTNMKNEWVSGHHFQPTYAYLFCLQDFVWKQKVEKKKKSPSHREGNIMCYTQGYCNRARKGQKGTIPQHFRPLHCTITAGFRRALITIMLPILLSELVTKNSLEYWRAVQLLKHNVQCIMVPSSDTALKHRKI